MENNKKINSHNSREEIKTIYINDIESLNDSTENNDINFNYSLKLKGENSNSYIDDNLLSYKITNQNIKIDSLNKSSEEIKNKNKLNNNKKNNKDNTSKKDIHKIKNENNDFYLYNSKCSDDLDNEIIYKLKNENELKNNKMEITLNNNNNNKNKKKKIIKSKYSKIKDNINFQELKKNEIEMKKEIEFLKKEILLKNEIIKKLIKENKNLIEKIKFNEEELFNYKNKEENLTKVIQENNKCINNLNELIIKIIPNEKNIKEGKINKSLNKTISKNINLNKNNNSKIKFNKLKEIINKNENFNNEIIKKDKDNNKLFNRNHFQGYFKLYSKNNIKKHLNKNIFYKFYNDDNKNNNNLNININQRIEKEKIRRNNTISLEVKRNNNFSTDIINDEIINNNLSKYLSKNNINKNEDNNNSEFYFLDKISNNKKDKNNKYLDISQKKLDNNIYHNDIDIYYLYNLENNYYKITNSPKIITNKNDSDRSYNLKYSKNLYFNPKENQRLLLPLNKHKIIHSNENLNNNFKNN